MNAPAREVLTVFIDGDEAPGVIFYALRPSGAGEQPAFPTDIWPDAHTRGFRLHGDAWEILGWDVAIHRWPSSEQWREAVRLTLHHLIEGGAVVAWLGAEGSAFSDPPYLFNPEWMTDSALAAMTSDGEFACAVDVDQPVPDDELSRLREHAQGLADAAS